MTKDEFKKHKAKLLRQLQERQWSVDKGLRKPQHVENKRLEFVALINEALKTDWFVMPKETSLIYRIYHNR